MKKKPVDKGNNNKMGLGSLHDAPPIPGIGKKKDDSPLGRVIFQMQFL